eukprot:CAMPEP_0114224556 /NCGR_PEP_ID=MMETSP0058-20121206/171_1 /TAXON_ID=36894 /ORGANISM="Pyramimonas parkeae, CCMP726" /LENGTH=330 /DNA_ID=CAMNT_0001335041 /DNA_START=121 /DNA_END=1113 /DNA_ORIENTATION=+
MEWTQRTFPPVELAFLIVLYLALAPVVFSSGSAAIWLAAIVYGYGIGMLLATVGTTLGMTLPFLLGRRSHWLQTSMMRMVQQYEQARVGLRAVSLAGEVRVIAILRLGPMPYTVLNYLCSVMPSVHYWRHYILPSVVTRAPINLSEIQFGIVMRDVAAAYRGEPPSTIRTIELVVSSLASVVTVVGGYVYARSAWQQVRNQVEEMDQLAADGRDLDNLGDAPIVAHSSDTGEALDHPQSRIEISYHSSPDSVCPRSHEYLEGDGRTGTHVLQKSAITKHTNGSVAVQTLGASSSRIPNGDTNNCNESPGSMSEPTPPDNRNGHAGIAEHP